mgnify:CR=1 FL=1
MKAILHRTGFEVEYIDDSLRVLAKKVDNPKDFNIKSEDRKKIINDISLKVIRDFDLLRRIPKNHSQLSFHISTTRASNQILEPSYGASRVLKNKFNLKNMILIISKKLKVLRTKKIKRILKGLYGQYFIANLSIKNATKSLPLLTYVYPKKSIKILMK